MRSREHTNQRTLAIYFASRGFGFVVFDGVEQLVDWGVKESWRGRNQRVWTHLGSLLDLYLPHCLVLADVSMIPRRAKARLATVSRIVQDLTSTKGVRLRHMSWLAVRQHFQELGAHTKQEIAELITHRLPELTPRLPPKRKPWMSEDYRMRIFEAVALALVYFEKGS